MSKAFDRDVFRQAAHSHRDRGYLLLTAIVTFLILSIGAFIATRSVTYMVIIPGSADSRRIPISYLP